MDSPPTKSIFVATVDTALSTKMVTDLKAQGFTLSTPMHTLFSAKKKGVVCTLYKSGKLTVQGKEMAEFVEFYLEPEVLGTFNYRYSRSEGKAPTPSIPLSTVASIGIDESGKGDFFGPLCIAGVYSNEKDYEKLLALGVKDSKLLVDSAAQKIAQAIKREFAHAVIKINPLKYNALYGEFNNLNTLLAWGHATAIEQLVEKTQCRNVIIDQFASEQVVARALQKKKLTDIALTQRHRGEEELIVAAASILARASFLEGLEALSRKYGVKLPKGASSATIAAGRTFIKKNGKEQLEHVAKLHFRTTAQLQ